MKKKQFFKHNLSDVQADNIGVDTQIWQFSVVLKNAKIGANCNINAHVFVENDVVIGNNVTVKSGVQLWDGITLEDNVFIGNNVWCGENVLILPGVSIGDNAIISAGSVVYRDVGVGSVVSSSEQLEINRRSYV